MEKPKDYKKNYLLKLFSELENSDDNLYLVFQQDFINRIKYFQSFIQFILNQLDPLKEADFDEEKAEILKFERKYKEENNLKKKPIDLIIKEFIKDFHRVFDEIGFQNKIIIMIDPTNIQSEDDFLDFLLLVKKNIDTLDKFKFIVVEKKGQPILSKLDSNIITKMNFPFDEDSVLEFFLRIIPNLESKKEKEILLVQVYRSVANIYLSKKDWDKTYFYYYKSLDLIEKIGDKKEKAIILNNIATAHYINNKNEESIEFYTQSLDLSNEINLWSLSIHSLNSLSLIQIRKKQIEKAIDYKKEALEISDKSNEFQISTSILGDIGILYYRLTYYEKCIDYLSKSIDLAKEKNIEFEQSKQLKNLSKIYEKLNDNTQSKILLENAKKIEEKNGFEAMSDFDLDPDLF